MENIIEKDKKYIAGTYARFPVQIVSGNGSYVFDENGKKYIDMGSGIGVTSFGIGDPQWKKAVISQLDAVQHMSNLYYTSPCAELAELLCEKTGMKKVFFSNSGAEANECAIKTARKYASDKKGPEYYNIITLNNSFHGRTLTTLAATGQEHYHELFQPLTPGFLYADAGDLEGISKMISENKVAAVMIECIQGEGGVIPLEKEFVSSLRTLTEENDVLLIIDEVQTGNGRSGALYSYMNYGIVPDIVTTAKGLGGGLPIGATLLSDKVQNVLGHGDHGSTFGGNPISCAGAISIIKRLDDKFLSEVKEKSELVFSLLRSSESITSVTGTGLMIGFKAKKPTPEIVKACMEKGVLCLSAKDKVRLLPALNISKETLKEALDTIISICEA